LTDLEKVEMSKNVVIFILGRIVPSTGLDPQNDKAESLYSEECRTT
jgi:hypothetical protein